MDDTVERTVPLAIIMVTIRPPCVPRIRTEAALLTETHPSGRSESHRSSIFSQRIPCHGQNHRTHAVSCSVRPRATSEVVAARTSSSLWMQIPPPERPPSELSGMMAVVVVMEEEEEELDLRRRNVASTVSGWVPSETIL